MGAPCLWISQSVVRYVQCALATGVETIKAQHTTINSDLDTTRSQQQTGPLNKHNFGVESPTHSMQAQLAKINWQYTYIGVVSCGLPRHGADPSLDCLQVSQHTVQRLNWFLKSHIPITFHVSEFDAPLNTRVSLSRENSSRKTRAWYWSFSFNSRLAPAAASDSDSCIC